MVVTVREVDRFLGDHGPVDIVTVDGASFNQLHIRHLDDDTVVLNYEDETGEAQAEEFELSEKLYQALEPNERNRTEIDDDLQDAVNAAGYTVVSTEQEEESDNDEDNDTTHREGLTATGITPSPETTDSATHGNEKKKELMGSPTYVTHLFNSEGRRALIEWAFRKIEEGDTDDYSKSAITEQTGIMRNTIINHIDILVEYGIIEEVGSDARPRYKAPEDETVITALMEMNAVLAEERTE